MILKKYLIKTLNNWFTNNQIPYFYNTGVLDIFDKQHHNDAKFNFILDALIKTVNRSNEEYEYFNNKIIIWRTTRYKKGELN